MQIISHNDYTTVVLPKTVAISGGAAELKTAMLTLCDQDCKNIVLDFSSVTLLDSVALGKILFVQHRLTERGGGLEFINVKSQHLKKLFKLINLQKVIKIEENEGREMIMEEQEAGKVTHYFRKAAVAGIELTAPLNLGDTIVIRGATTEFEQRVDSMQIDQQDVETAKAGDIIGIKVKGKAREGDIVYKK